MIFPESRYFKLDAPERYFICAHLKISKYRNSLISFVYVLYIILGEKPKLNERKFSVLKQ